MPFKYPSQARGRRSSTVPMVDVSGGINVKSSAFTIRASEMQQLQNWYLSEDGSLLIRRGTLTLNSVSLGANPIDGGARVYFSAANYWLAMYQGTIYQSTNGATFSSSATGFTSGSPAWFVQYLAYLYASTAVDAPMKWDGTTWTAMGIAAPLSAPTVAATGSGTLSGAYTAEVTFGTPTVESNPSPASNTATLATQELLVTGIPISSDPNCNQRRIYLFKTGVSSTYQLALTINDNTTTTATINVDQQFWTVVVPSMNNPWPVGPWIKVLWKNRLWGGGDPNHINRLYFSQIFVPEEQPVPFFIDLPFAQNGQITAIFPLGDLLLVCSDNQVFYVYGDTPYSFTVKASFCQSGTPSPWAIDIYQNAAVRISRYGALAFDGSQDTSLSDPIEPFFSGVLPQYPAMNYGAARRVCLKYYDRVKAFVATWPTAGGSNVPNDTCYWYFLRRPAWVQDSRPASILLVDDGVGGTGSIYAWDPSNGILREWDINYTDDGNPITATFQTGVLQGKNPLTSKQWTWFTLRCQPGSFTMTMSGQVDQGAVNDSFTMNLARGATYGSAQYG